MFKYKYVENKNDFEDSNKGRNINNIVYLDGLKKKTLMNNLLIRNPHDLLYWCH